MEVLKKVLLDYDALTLIGFVVVLIVQLKIMRSLQTIISLLMFYGKQIEETRKAAVGGVTTRYATDVPPNETGLYEVLKE